MSVPPENPESGFNAFKLSPPLLRAVADAGFTEPRPVQVHAIPAALEGRDILGLAQTGTGKTAAFVLPLLERLLGERDHRGPPRVLIVAPTRELAIQIDAETRRLARHTRVRTTTVFGGVSQRSQVAALGRRPEIVVACPGRLLDLYGQRALRLDGVHSLVLDEADHMFDMGFLPDVRRILDALPAERQNMLFSATMPNEIRGLADSVLNDPHVVELEHSRPVDTIDHALYPIAKGDKVDALERIIDETGFVSAIVFTRTKHRARRLAQQLQRSGHRAVALQGNMSQNARQRAMQGFRKHEFDILVATDIAARGIDVQGVSHVVNFDMPDTPDAYTHRIGRTGRAERSGRAYTLVTGEDFDLVPAVERRIGQRIPRRSIDGIKAAPFPSSPDPNAPPLRRGSPAGTSRSAGRRGGGGGGGRPGGGRPGAGRPSGGRPSGGRPSGGRPSGGRPGGGRPGGGRPGPRGRGGRAGNEMARAEGTGEQGPRPERTGDQGAQRGRPGGSGEGAPGPGGDRRRKRHRKPGPRQGRPGGKPPGGGGR